MSEKTPRELYEEYVDSKKNEIKSKLRLYLQNHNINIGKDDFFSCPNKPAHKHGDRKPSASIKTSISGIEYWNCFACEAGGDVFNLAHYQEGLSREGAEFISKTVPNLAKQLNVKWDPESVMTPEMKDIHQMYKANEIISNKAKNNLVRMIDNDTDMTKFLKTRNITKEDIKTFDLGYLKLSDAINELAKNNIEFKIMKEIGITQNDSLSKRMFDKSQLLFTLRNQNGRAIGFASRNINYKKGSSVPKYINTRTNKIFAKKSFLYGLNITKEYCKEKGGAYIYEGYTDVITSYKNSINNCCAVCGASFNENHIRELHKCGLSSLIFALDGDTSGKQATMRTVEKIFAKNKMLRPFTINIPDEKDPDEIIREDKDKFINLHRYGVAEYKATEIFKLASTNEMANVDEEIEEFFNWLINYEPNHIKRTKVIKTIAKMTGFSEEDLKKQLSYQSKMMSDETARKVNGIWYDMISRGRTAILKERLQVLDDAKIQLSKCMGETEIDVVGDQLSELNKINEEYQNNKVEQVKTGWNKFDTNVLIPQDASVVMIGAYPNVGKSTLMRNLAIQIMKNNQDLGVIYFTLDDPMKQTIPGIISKMTKVNINDVRYQQMIPASKKRETIEKINKGFQNLQYLIQTRRLAIFDQSNANTMGEIETLVNIVGDEMMKNNRKPVIIIDSLHSIAMNVKTDRRVDVMNNIRGIRRLANINHIPVFGVAELRKGNNMSNTYRRPRLRDFSETGDIEYRVTVGIILENQLKERENPELYWRDDRVCRHQQLPVLTTHIDKNKEGYFFGAIHFKTNPFTSSMYEYTDQEIANLRQSINNGDTN